MTGQTACQPCPLGHVGPSALLTACAPCVLPNFTTASGAQQCSSCNAGFYAVFRDVTRAEFAECRMCPPGADCPALRNVSVSPRYYAVRNATTLVLETYLCAGGRCAADGTCGEHRLASDVNPLCGQCSAGFSEWDGSCVACPGVNGGLVFGLLTLAWLVVLAVHALSQSDSESSALRIAMYMWQISLVMVGRASWARWAAFFDLNFLVVGGGSSASCPFPVSAAGMALVLLLGPLVVFALLATTAAAHAMAQRLGLDPCSGRWRRQRQQQQQQQGSRALSTALAADSSSDAERGDAADMAAPAGRHVCAAFDTTPYARSAVSLYFFTFNQVTRQCLELFNCATVVTADGSASLVASLPALRCDSAAHRSMVPLAVVLLVVYAVVVPALLLRKLWSVRKRGVAGLAQEDADSEERLQRPPWWGVVSAPFREEAFWWGLAQLLFRAALVASSVLLSGDDALRWTTVSLINLFVAVLQAWLLPNVNAKDNRWESLTLVALVVVAVMVNNGTPDVWVGLVVLGVAVSTTVRTVASRARACVRLLRQSDGSKARVLSDVVSSSDPADGYAAF